jgi:hypothetical protein
MDSVLRFPTLLSFTLSRSSFSSASMIGSTTSYPAGGLGPHFFGAIVNTFFIFCRLACLELGDYGMFVDAFLIYADDVYSKHNAFPNAAFHASIGLND